MTSLEGVRRTVVRAERAYPKLIYCNEVDPGCHFAAWPEPALFNSEVRAAFRSLRQPDAGGRHAHLRAIRHPDTERAILGP